MVVIDEQDMGVLLDAAVVLRRYTKEVQEMLDLLADGRKPSKRRLKKYALAKLRYDEARDRYDALLRQL